jgi:hypothetical protein
MKVVYSWWMGEVSTDSRIAPFLLGTQVIGWQGKSMGEAFVDKRTTARLSFHITLTMPRDSCIFHANIPCGARLKAVLLLNSYGIPTRFCHTFPVA